MKLGIVGLPNVGKSTLFNSLTKAGAESANYPFCTIDPNVGIVTVPDARVDYLAEKYHSKKVIPAAIEFVDIAGLVKGASKGEGLGNQFLANIREVDAIVHVVRCFDDGNIVHVDGSVNPLRDIETINFELIFSDIEVLDRRIAKSTKGSRNDKSLAHEVEFLSKVKAHLEDGKLAKTFEVDDEEDQEILNSCNLLTIKPVIFAANVNEDELAGEDNDYVKAVREYAADVDAKVFVVCAQIEQEISELDDDEKKEFLEDLGLEESGLEKLISASYSLLGLISFLTSGEDETRAWTIKEGTKAPQAAGKIHTDFERGFICAEVVSFDGREPKELLRIAACLEEHFPHSMAKAVVKAAKEQNLVHEELHSKVEYIVAHGISSKIEEKKVVIGSYHFVFEDENCKIPEGMQEKFATLPDEYSHLYMAIEQELAAVICIEDPIREEAREVVARLKEVGLSKVVMMTGDSERTAAAIAKRVGVDEYYAEVLPEDKENFVEKEKSEGRKVIMIGDGINDSPALSAADAGIAISDGAEIAREIADITIAADDLREVVTLKLLSNLMLKRIHRNYRSIVGINSGLIVLGVTGMIQPTMSALLHNTSTLLISLRSMRNLLPEKEKVEL